MAQLKIVPRQEGLYDNVPPHEARVLYRRTEGLIVTKGLDYRSARRRELEDLIEAAIAALDAFDGDPDLEDTHDLEHLRESKGPWLYADGGRNQTRAFVDGMWRDL